MHPLVLLPAVAGGTVCGLMAVFEKPFAWAVGLAGGIVGAGMLMSRAILSGDKIAEQALKEVEAEANMQWRNELDALDNKLSQDRDERDERLLRSLRELFATLKDDRSWRTKYDSVTISKLRSALDDSFAVSIQQLKDAWDCKQKAEQSGNKRVKEMLRQDRERLLEQVTQCVAEFESVLRDLRGIPQDTGQTDPHHCITRLKQTLEIGKRVRSSMESKGLSLD